MNTGIETDTFKKWLRYLKTIGVIGFVIIFLASAEIGVVSYKEGRVVKNDFLSVKDVTQAVEHTGLILTTNLKVNPAEYKMGEVEPNIYQVKNFDGMLFIYQFASIGERDTISEQYEEATRNNSSSKLNMFTSKWSYNLAYAAKNSIIVVGISQFPNVEYAQRISPVLTNLGKAIFYNLNEGQQIVYQGEGENWKGKVIINYYNHFWTDDKGVLRYDGWNHRQPILEFKGDPNTVKSEFSYEFKSSIDKFGGTDSDGFDARQLSEHETASNYGGEILGFGALGGSGAMPPKDNDYSVTVKWNNKQETFKLKASE